MVLAGGGLGLAHAREDDTYARLASPFFWVPEELLGATVEAIVTTQRDFGNREDRHRARLKYTIDDRGLDWFRAEIERRVGLPLDLAPDLPAWHDSDEHLGWFEQADGRWCYGVHVDSGRVADGDVRQRSALRELVERYQPEVRLTARQDVLLCGLDEGDRDGVEAVLRRLRRDAGGADAAAAAPGHGVPGPAHLRPGAGRGRAGHARHARRPSQGPLDAEGLGDLPLQVNVTGCPNGCARPYTAEVGIVGRTKTGYDVYVGGAVGGDRLAERARRDVPLGRVGPPRWRRCSPATPPSAAAARASASSATGGTRRRRAPSSSCPSRRPAAAARGGRYRTERRVRRRTTPSTWSSTAGPCLVVGAGAGGRPQGRRASSPAGRG